MRGRPIQQDLSSKLQACIGEVLTRETTIARHVLTDAEVMIMLMEASVSLVLSTAATIASTMPDEDYASSFDRTIKAIVALAGEDRERSLAAVSERRSAAA